jgi:hypothetical protein
VLEIIGLLEAIVVSLGELVDFRLVDIGAGLECLILLDVLLIIVRQAIQFDLNYYYYYYTYPSSIHSVTDSTTLNYSDSSRRCTV